MKQTALFLAHIRRVARLGQAPRTQHDAEPGDTGDAVQVLTVHAAKGLEFPVVFVPNVSQGRFPPNPRPSVFGDTDVAILLGASDADSDEETRLFFVAVTRARDTLVLSRADKYDNRAAKSSVLLEPWEAMPEVATVRWKGTDAVVPVSNGDAGSKQGGDGAQEKATPAQELDHYLRCPRRYFYETVCGYGDTRPRTAYDA